jgi:hypothetical protein
MARFFMFNERVLVFFLQGVYAFIAGLDFNFSSWICERQVLTYEFLRLSFFMRGDELLELRNLKIEGWLASQEREGFEPELPHVARSQFIPR